MVWSATNKHNLNTLIITMIGATDKFGLFGRQSRVPAQVSGSIQNLRLQLGKWQIDHMMQWSAANLSPHTRNWRIDHLTATQINGKLGDHRVAKWFFYKPGINEQTTKINYKTNNRETLLQTNLTQDHCHHHHQGECNRGGFDRPFSWLEYCVILLAVRIIIIPPSGVGRTSWFCLPRGNHHHHHPFHQYISHYPLILQKKKKTVFISHYRKCSMSHLAPLMQLTFSISPINAEKYGN